MANDDNNDGMLDGKTILVTGGTGTIGAALCETMARHGADVAFTYRKNEGRARELTETVEQLGRRCSSGAVAADDGVRIEAFVEEVEETFGRIDVLVNNLGITQVLPFALIDEADWDLMFDVNLKSMFLFAKAAVRGMIRERSGVILNMGSIAGHRLLEVPVHYATAKAGVMGFTLSLAKELSRYQVRVNAVVPGLIEGGIGSNVSPRQLEQYNEYNTMGRPGQPPEVAELAAFLVSDRASYINAQCIAIDGGL